MQRTLKAVRHSCGLPQEVTLVAKLLLDKGADLKVEDKLGLTALKRSQNHGHKEIEISLAPRSEGIGQIVGSHQQTDAPRSPVPRFQRNFEPGLCLFNETWNGHSLTAASGRLRRTRPRRLILQVLSRGGSLYYGSFPAFYHFFLTHGPEATAVFCAVIVATVEAIRVPASSCALWILLVY